MHCRKLFWAILVRGRRWSGEGSAVSPGAAAGPVDYPLDNNSLISGGFSHHWFIVIFLPISWHWWRGVAAFPSGAAAKVCAWPKSFLRFFLIDFLPISWHYGRVVSAIFFWWFVANCTTKTREGLMHSLLKLPQLLVVCWSFFANFLKLGWRMVKESRTFRYHGAIIQTVVQSLDIVK